MKSDEESEFYKTLAGTDWTDGFKFEEIMSKDVFDSTLGNRVTVNSDGRLALMLVMEPLWATAYAEAMWAVDDHECEEAGAFLHSVMRVLLAGVNQVWSELDPDVRNTWVWQHPTHHPQKKEDT